MSQKKSKRKTLSPAKPITVNKDGRSEKPSEEEAGFRQLYGLCSSKKYNTYVGSLYSSPRATNTVSVEFSAHFKRTKLECVVFVSSVLLYAINSSSENPLYMSNATLSKFPRSRDVPFVSCPHRATSAQVPCEKGVHGL